MDLPLLANDYEDDENKGLSPNIDDGVFHVHVAKVLEVGDPHSPSVRE